MNIQIRHRSLRDALCYIGVLKITIVLAADAAAGAQARPNLAGKVVLANVDRHQAVFRVGKVEKKIAPRKASILTPKQYPTAVQIWSGNRTLGWQEHRISGAGIYLLRFTGGKWMLVKKTSGAAGTAAARGPTTTVRQTVVNAINDIAGVLQDPAPNVVFNHFGPSTLDFTIYYWIDTKQIGLLKAKDTVIRAIKTAFEQTNIEMPYPTQTVHLRQE